MFDSDMTDDPIHFPKDIRVVMLYDPIQDGEHDAKIMYRAKKTWESFGYHVELYPIVDDEDLDGLPFHVKLTKRCSIGTKRLVYTHVKLWREIRKSKKSCLVVPRDVALFKDLPRKYLNYKIWTPLQKIIFSNPDNISIDRSLINSGGFKSRVEIFNQLVNLGGDIKNIEMEFNGFYYVNASAANDLIHYFTKRCHTPLELFCGQNSDQEVRIFHTIEELEEKGYTLLRKYFVDQVADQYGDYVLGTDSWTEFSMVHTRYQLDTINHWLFYKFLPYPDPDRNKLTTGRPWGDTFDINDSQIYVKQIWDETIPLDGNVVDVDGINNS